MSYQVYIITWWSCYGYAAGCVKDQIYREVWQVSGERRWHRRGQAGTNCLHWHIWPGVLHPITHLTDLPSPDQALVSPSKYSSHCLKTTHTNKFAQTCPVICGILRMKTYFCNTWKDVTCLILHTTAAVLGRGSITYVLLQSLLISQVKREQSRHQLVGQQEGSVCPLLRRGSA